MELEAIVSEVFEPAKLIAKRTCDERIIMRSQKNFSRNIIIRSAAYNALYETAIIPAKWLQDVQQEVDNQRKSKLPSR